MEANNAKLACQVADLKREIAEKDEEMRQLSTQSKEGLDWIRKFIGNLGNMVNKATFFVNEVKAEGQLSVPKIVNVLVEFKRKMEATLVEMRKLLPGPQPELFRLPIPSSKGTLPINRATVELKTPQQQCLGNKPITKVEKVVTPEFWFRKRLRWLRRSRKLLRPRILTLLQGWSAQRRQRRSPFQSLARKRKRKGLLRRGGSGG